MCKFGKMNITEETKIRDIFDMVEEPKEIDINLIQTTGQFFAKYKDWDGTLDHLNNINKLDSRKSFHRIQNVDLKYPIIIAVLNGQYHKIIDGHHRLLKAIQNKLSVITVRVVNLDGVTSSVTKFIKSVLQNIYILKEQKSITEEMTIRDILNIVQELREIDITDLKILSFYKRYKDWDGTIAHLNNINNPSSYAHWKTHPRITNYRSHFHRIQNVDLKYPIIIAVKNGQYHKIIDGHHRLLKAIQNKLSVITARVINLDGFTRNECRLIERLSKTVCSSNSNHVLRGVKCKFN